MNLDIIQKWVVDKVDESAYKDQIPVLINAVKAISMASFQAFSIYDFHKKQVLYHSNEWDLYFKNLPKENDTRFEALMSSVDSDGLKMNYEVVDLEAKQFLMSRPIDERSSLIFNSILKFTFNGTIIRLHCKSIPLLLTDEGNLWITLDMAFPCTVKQRESYYFENSKTHERYTLNKDSLRWEQKHVVILNAREKEVLLLSMQGYTIISIARHLFVTEDCVKTCRRKLFEKFGVGSIQEAITYAMNMGLL